MQRNGNTQIGSRGQSPEPVKQKKINVFETYVGW